MVSSFSSSYTARRRLHRRRRRHWHRRGIHAVPPPPTPFFNSLFDCVSGYVCNRVAIWIDLRYRICPQVRHFTSTHSHAPSHAVQTPGHFDLFQSFSSFFSLNAFYYSLRFVVAWICYAIHMAASDKVYLQRQWWVFRKMKRLLKPSPMVGFGMEVWCTI